MAELYGAVQYSIPAQIIIFVMECLFHILCVNVEYYLLCVYFVYREDLMIFLFYSCVYSVYECGEITDIMHAIFNDFQ